MSAASIHATCVAIGDRGVLIRGPSGAGKSALALRLILDAPRSLPAAELVADDRVLLAAEGGILVARPVPQLAGLIEMRGLGIRRMFHRSFVAVRHVVDLAAPDAARMPPLEARRLILQGIEIERIPLCEWRQAPLVLACIIGTRDHED
ncbi:HPr kinase/phosphatase C-terminal domain-containing protein [Xanthobacter autotrophicus]|uniref:HPr kinase/phosphorylase n=1 Tax=Xanthobacter TaxID=279 RepID=UPI0024AA98D1|nr:HPr kinase/phosphatase C-terminal domain-containing protein [Xanthobacter autotrophicus]MDI4666172.1 HPr kinase/phosphatase C-terminal domain-containing protein [Xanthobacter autotrophicus]